MKLRSSRKPRQGELDAPLEVPGATGAPRVRLGDMLVNRGLITEEQLSVALSHQQESGGSRRLGEVLVELRMLGERDFLEALAQQFGIPLVDLRQVVPEPDALLCLPETLVRAETVLPVKIHDGSLIVAILVEPVRELISQLNTTAKMPIRLVLALNDDIRLAIDRAYSALKGLEQYASVFDADKAAVIAEDDSATKIDENAPVVQVVTRILTQAVRSRASDVHIEPQDNAVRVRFRVDGALYDAVTLPEGLAQALVSRIKILAEMNIVERRRSQDGQLEITVDGRDLDVRVATMATIWGEKVVMRVLDRTRSLFDLPKLGMSAQTQVDFSRLIRSPFGMVICAGPTGSGKTTTLYAALNQIANSERNVTTIEDPVEYVFPGINQIQINEQADITFSGGLKAILRQDPDVILVGEMRDVETARIAVQSALTGHLVLSSLHATDATAALHRFLDMGIESFLVSSSVVGVMAQRLVRRICESCREPFEPSTDELAFYEEWGGKPKTDFTHGVGCNFCAGTGYVDRVGVYELLKVTPAIKQLIVDHAPRDVIWQCAIDEGMTTLRDEALRVIEENV